MLNISLKAWFHVRALGKNKYTAVSRHDEIRSQRNSLTTQYDGLLTFPINYG